MAAASRETRPSTRRSGGRVIVRIWSVTLAKMMVLRTRFDFRPKAIRNRSP
jgi:hypothetical protein